MLSIYNIFPLAGIVITPWKPHNKIAFQMKSDILEHYHLFSCTDPSTCGEILLTVSAALLPQDTDNDTALNISLEASKPLLLL